MTLPPSKQDAASRVHTALPSARCWRVGGRVDGMMIALVRGYQRLLSPLFAELGSQCCFEPSCSQYMIDAVQMRGAAFGLGLGLWRLARCNPLNAGGYDPPPRRRTLVERDVSRET